MEMYVIILKITLSSLVTILEIAGNYSDFPMSSWNQQRKAFILMVLKILIICLLILGAPPIFLNSEHYMTKSLELKWYAVIPELKAVIQRFPHYRLCCNTAPST